MCRPVPDDLRPPHVSCIVSAFCHPSVFPDRFGNRHHREDVTGGGTGQISGYLFMIHPAHLHELGGPVRGKLRDLPPESWRHHYPVWPGVMAVLCGASPSSLRHRMQTLCRLYQADPLLARAEGLKATLTTLAELQQRGPFDPIFTRAEGGGPVDLLGRSRDRARSAQRPRQGPAAAPPRTRAPAPRTW